MAVMTDYRNNTCKNYYCFQTIQIFGTLTLITGYIITDYLQNGKWG